MQTNLLQADVENRGIVLDPRTKMVVLMTIAIFVLGGAGGDIFTAYLPCFCTLPFLMFLTAGRWRTALTFAVIYTVSYTAFWYLGPRTEGLANFLILAVCGILSRFYPSIMAGAYLIETTTVSEFSAAMSRMHVSEKISIPLCVMFRFFPTVADEFASINAAMRMRDIRLMGKNAGKMIEYRIVPLMVCSAKIGEELNAAAITRGLGGEVHRTNVCKIGFHVQDVVFLLLCLIPYVLWILELTGMVFVSGGAV